MSLLKRYQKKLSRSSEKLFSDHMNNNMNFAYSIARNYLSADEDIQDAIQVSFIKAWNSFDSFDTEKSQFSTWFYSILKNECLDRIRKVQRSPEINSLYPDNLTVDESRNSDLKESYKNVLQMADKLSKTQKEIFILRDIKGLSIKEVAACTKQSKGSIKSNLHLARKNIKQWMIEENMI